MTSMDMLPDSLIEMEIERLRSERTYDPAVHDLGFVVNDLDARMQRVERAFEALLEDVASNPHTAVEMARSYLDQAA